MHFFHDTLVNFIVQQFKSQAFITPDDANAFFGTFGVGYTTSVVDRPLERFQDYEELLRLLWQADKTKYAAMHKGTPFYFLGWLAFDLERYETALHYLDAAIAEDVRNYPDLWTMMPGATFINLKDDETLVGSRTVACLRKRLAAEISRFNSVSGQKPLQLDAFLDALKARFTMNTSAYAIVSGLYVFVYEFTQRWHELMLRSGVCGGGSLPFLLHLFKGGLVFESILKYYYPNDVSGAPHRSLGPILQLQAFRDNFGLAAPIVAKAETLGEIVAQDADDVAGAFATTGRLRNTTGHNLVWDDTLGEPAVYRRLFRQEMRAILTVLSVKLDLA